MRIARNILEGAVCYNIAVVLFVFLYATVLLVNGFSIPENIISLYCAGIKSDSDCRELDLPEQRQRQLISALRFSDSTESENGRVCVQPRSTILIFAEHPISSRNTGGIWYGSFFYGYPQADKFIKSISNATVYYGLAFALLALIHLYWIRPYLNHRVVYCYIVFCFLLWLPMLRFRHIISRDWEVTQTEIGFLREKQEYLQSLMDDAQMQTGSYALAGTGEKFPLTKLIDRAAGLLWPLKPQAGVTESESVFIGKPPYFPFAYARYDVDFYNYVFYAPGATPSSLARLNRELSFTALGDGFFLGCYEEIISRLIIGQFAFRLACSIWLLIWLRLIVIAVGTIRRQLAGNGGGWREEKERAISNG